MTHADYAQLIQCLDLTSLNDNDSTESITILCQKASTPLGHVAAVCIYPQFVSHAWKILMNTPIKIATVANFPKGDESIDVVTQTIQQAILDGASEIDVVIPYHAYQNNQRQLVKDFISQCKLYCGDKALLKTILETGALNADEIHLACIDAITSGSNFLKTSTGKIQIGATTDAASILLNEIKQSEKPVGFKASGGIRTYEQAKPYIQLCKNILGEDKFHPDYFRIGASSLLDNILEIANAENR